MIAIKKVGLVSFLSLLLLGSFVTTASLWGRGIRNIEITITPDKEEYGVEETAFFSIEMQREGNPVRIKPEQIEATFPDEDTGITLTQIAEGVYIYTTPELTEIGNYTLSVTVHSYGGVRSIEKLEKTKQKFEEKIEWLEELKEKVKSKRRKKCIERLIAIYQRIIQRIETTIKRIKERSIIGSNSCTISTIAERSVEFLTVKPEGIFTSESSSVTVTAQVALHPHLSDVNLLRLDENDQIIDTLGNLHDDGLNGDVLAGDDIFTLEVTFTEPTPTEIRLQISATYTTLPSPILSADILTIDVVTPISEEDFALILSTEEEAKEKFEELKEIYGDDHAREMTADWLVKSFEGIEDAGVSIDNDTIWILYTSGLEGGITTHPVGTRGSNSTSSADSLITPGNSKAIVLAPFFDEFSPDDESDHIAGKLSQIWEPTSPIKNSAVTVNLMKTLPQYGIVSITSHGSINSKEQVQIYSREKATLLNRLRHIFDLMTRRIGIVNGYYVIRPKFITHYARRSPYPKSLVYIAACHSKGNDTLSNAFLNKGAYTYFGYDNIVYSEFAFSIGTALFNHLVDDGMTTGETYDALPNKTDPTFPNANFLMDGGDDLRLIIRPIIKVIYPADGEEIMETKPQIKVEIYTPGYEENPDTPEIDLSSITMKLSDYQGKQVSGTLSYDPNEDALVITVTLIPDSDLQVDNPDTCDVDEGKYTVTANAKDVNELAAGEKVWVFFVKEIEGKYLYIADSDNHRIVKTKIDESGWETYGEQGGKVGKFNSPYGVAYDKTTGFIYVADKNNFRIVKTKIDGSGWESLGSYGNGEGEFDYPEGVAYDDEGFVYVADRDNHRIVKTKIDGSGWESLGSYGSGVGEFRWPKKIAYDKTTGFIYVADGDNHRIVKTKIDGSGWESLGTWGSGVKQFEFPYGVAYDDETGFIYVADYGNYRIVKTKIDGSGWESLGSYGSGVGEFSLHQGIVYEKETGFIYVSDGGNDRIVKTKIDGSGWESLGSYGSGVGQFHRPRGITK